MNELLKAYIDNELPAQEREKVEAELALNPALQTELNELKATGEYIEASAKPIDIQGLEATLAAIAKPKKRALWYRSPYAVLAACTIVLAFGLSTFSPFSSTNSALDFQAKMADKAASTAAPATSEAEMARSEAQGVYQSNAKAGVGFGGGAQSSTESPANPIQDTQTFGHPGESDGWKAQKQESASPSSPQYGNTQAAPNDPRLIIKNGSLGLRVKNLEQAATRTEAVAKQYGGFVESSDRSSGYNVKYANYSIRVDSKKFDSAMRDLRELGEVTGESVSGTDVTGQVADTQARLKQMRLEEEQYQEVLKSARKISDILEVKQYISDIRQDIEANEAQLKSLKDLASLSTITVTIEQREQIAPPKRTDWLSNAWIRAMNRFTGIGQYLVGTLINILVLAPFWLPFGIGIWWWNRKRNRG